MFKKIRFIAFGLSLCLLSGAFLVPVSEAAGPFGRFFNKPKSSVEKLAELMDDVENDLSESGTIAVKAPDIWGEARLTKHRQEFERIMSEELGTFHATFQGALARTDQAFLSNALAISAALGGPVAQGASSGGGSSGGSGDQGPPNDFTLVNNLTAQLAGQNPEDNGGEPQDPDPNNTFNIYREPPGKLISGDFAPNTSIQVEPTVLLDQRKRFLDHLHEIRRVNEGDDTSDSPGYSLNLVRIPVSVLPGGETRRGHGAEVTISAAPYLTEELLPSTFRSLVVNDLLDQLALAVTKFINDRENQEALKGLLESSDGTESTDSEEPDAEQQPQCKEKQEQLNGKQKQLNGEQKQLNGENGAPDSSWELPQELEAARRKLEGLPRRNEKEPSPDAKNIVHKTGKQLASQQWSTSFRKSRLPVPSTQLSKVFGSVELALISAKVFQHRESFDLNERIHYSDVRAFLKEEIQASYDFLIATQKASSVIPPPTSTKREEPQEVLYFDPWNQFCGTLTHDLRRPKQVVCHRRKFFEKLHKFARDCEQNQNGRSDSEVQGRTRSRAHLLNVSGEEDSSNSNPDPIAHNVTEALAWGVLVESSLLNEHLKRDIERTSRDPNCGCFPAPGVNFYGPEPSAEARMIFTEYVRCRWPIRVFAIDPVTQEQNIADSFGMRREMQLAIALAFASGQIEVQEMMRFIRNIEIDMETIDLNKTAVGFGHGTDTFGWRFYPRYQTPPIERNATVFFRDLIIGGPTEDDRLKKQKLEPGMRECTALVLMPSFISHCVFDIRSNWFELDNPGDTCPNMKETMEWSRKIRKMQDSVEACVRDAHLYRGGEVSRLLRRVDQLSRRLPLQTVHAKVPNENTIGGFEMFDSGITDLAPELHGHYGAPGVDVNSTTVLYLVGKNFSVHDTHVVVGNREVDFQLISREVMKVAIPPGVQIIPPRSGSDEKPDEKPFVDVHVATPYGVTKHLQIPVDETRMPARSVYAWNKSDVGVKYFYKEGADEDSSFTVPISGIRPNMPYRYAISAPEDVIRPGEATVTMTLTSANDEVLGAIEKDISVSAYLDTVQSQYVIKGDAYVSMHEAIKNAVVGYLSPSDDPLSEPPGTFEARLRATMELGDSGPTVDIGEMELKICFKEKK